MKFFIFFLCAVSSCYAEVKVNYLGVKKAGAKNLVSLEIYNGSQKEVKSVRATFVFKDQLGKIVDVKNSWAYGGGVKKVELIEKLKRKKTSMVFTVTKSYTSIEIFPTKVIMSDGSIKTPILEKFSDKIQKEPKK